MDIVSLTQQAFSCIYYHVMYCDLSRKMVKVNMWLYIKVFNIDINN